MRNLTDMEIEKAAQILLDLRANGRLMDDLPPELVPEATADIQRIIWRVNQEIAHPVVGWKIYSVFKPMQPVFFSPIYDRIKNGGNIPAGISPLRLIEPEIMFRCDIDIPPREKKYSHVELSEMVTAVVGMEVIGARFDMGTLEQMYKRSKSQISNHGALSDNIANGCIIVGDEIPHWQNVDFSEVVVTMTQDSEEVIRFVGGNPIDDPFLMTLVGVNRLRRHGGLKAGDIIVTNSSTSFFSVRAGSEIVSTYEGLGRVSARFEHT